MDILKVDRPVDLPELKHILGLVASQKPRGRKGGNMKLYSRVFFSAATNGELLHIIFEKGEIWV